MHLNRCAGTGELRTGARCPPSQAAAAWNRPLPAGSLQRSAVWQPASSLEHERRACHRAPLPRRAAAGPPAGAAPDEPWSTHKWQWRGHAINYLTAGCGQPVLLVHGFGASGLHYRRNIPALAAQGYKVYAIDLLGFGRSAKPAIPYSMELWAQLLTDFLAEFVQAPAVLVGNSIGSLACMMVAADEPERTRGLVLLNAAGAMNNKGVVSDARILLAYPIFLLIDLLLSIRPLAQALFTRVRSRETIRGALRGVYVNADAVDDALVDAFEAPAYDEGALDVFVSVITGPPGPKPWALLPRVRCPLLVLWGDTDALTPLDGPVGKYLQALPETRADATFQLLAGAGHCLQDDAPDAVNAALLRWLSQLQQGGGAAAQAGDEQVAVGASTTDSGVV